MKTQKKQWCVRCQMTHIPWYSRLLTREKAVDLAVDLAGRNHNRTVRVVLAAQYLKYKETSS